MALLGRTRRTRSNRNRAGAIVLSMGLTIAAAAVVIVATAPAALALGDIALVTGAGPGGGPHVRSFTASGVPTSPDYFAYSPGFRGGVYVAMGDVSGDGVADIVTGAGPGGGPHVTVVDGVTGAVIRSFFAYDPRFTGGVTVAAANASGHPDGHADIITGAGAGGGPHVKVFDGKTGATLQSFFAYNPAFTGGVFVAAGNVTGHSDGHADIITGAGAGGGPHVRVFDGKSTAPIRDVFAYDVRFPGGVSVGAGDVDGDGRVDVITGAGPGGGAHVKVIDGTSLAVIRSFFAYEPTFSGGVLVAGGHVSSSAHADIITGPATQGGKTVKVIDGLSGVTLFKFFAYDPSFSVRVAGNPRTPRPSVTVEQAAAQADPTNGDPIRFTAAFSQPVSGFSASDVTVSGTAGGKKSVTVTGGPAAYTIEVSGMRSDGTVIASIPEGVASNATGGLNLASTSTDQTVTFSKTQPSVGVEQAASQADPTNTQPIWFTAVFSQPVTGFTAAGVTITGTAGGSKVATVTGGPSTYTIEISGITSDGTVTVGIPADVATDAAGNLNLASTSVDGTVTYLTTPPSVTINQAAGQADPTNASPIRFTAVFSRAVSGFTGSDVTIGGTAGGSKTATVTGGPAVYTVEVAGITSDGTVSVDVPAGAASDAAGNLSVASTSTDQTVTYQATQLTVTINSAAGQADPTNESPIRFTAVFSEPVTGFTASDVALSGSAGGPLTAGLTGSGATYTIEVSGMTSDGTVIASIPAGVASDAAGNLNLASTSFDKTVTYIATPPSVTVEQAASQADPTSSGPITFTVVFSRPVTGFTASDVTISGTAGGELTAGVSGSGTTYTIEVSGMTSDGTVTVSIPEGVATDSIGNLNLASTSTDDTVTFALEPAPPV